jgi:adenosylcobinamide kinase / adenosylcobinamide-phosphate guanylyltransferase
MAILITGGARSGKSRFAEEYARRVGSHGIYIATCQPYDEEMKKRVVLHQTDRDRSGFHWETIEEPFSVADRLDRLSDQISLESKSAKRMSLPSQAPVVLVDCLTLWLTNWLLREERASDGESALNLECERLIASAARYPFPLIFVTNEVGGGIVPEYPLGRQFRDEAGRLNQRMAEVCDRIFLITAGIPVELKSLAFRWEDL